MDEKLTQQISLSICAVTGFSSLRDELPEFQAQGVGNDRQPLKNFGRLLLFFIFNFYFCLAYLITLAARNSTDCGIVRPSCFAVLRLTSGSRRCSLQVSRST